MIIEGKLPGTESPVNLIVENERVIRIEPYQTRSSCDFGGEDLYLSPGFFDPQVNGFAGVDFNSPRLTPEAFQRAARALAATGVTRFLPTVITSSHDRTIRQLKIIADALESAPLLRRMCFGIHLEGPYISTEDGPRGVHLRDFVRPPEWEEFERFQEACEGRIKCVTLAPEVKGAIPFIEKAAALGTIIGIGHTNATEEVIEEAVRAGARLSCHLGNAAPRPFPHQHPIRRQLVMDRLMVSLIADGIHLAPEVVKDFVQTKGSGGILLTTDSMAGAGASSGRYTLGDLEVEVGPDRAARFIRNGRLAGSTLTMDRAIRNVIRFAGVDLASAIGMATKNGQKLFQEVGGEIIEGDAAHLVLFECRDELKVRSTWIEGEKIF